MGELDGKVAIVTGGGRLRSIGRSAVLELARLGADVVITGTNRSPDTFPDDEKEVGWRGVDSVADEVRSLGRRALTMPLDVTDASQVEDVINSTEN